MLKPSYSELMQVLNNDPNLDDKITSRYAIVIAASKRARQLIDGEKSSITKDTEKAVTVAINEMHQGIVKITQEKRSEDISNVVQDEDLFLNSDDNYTYDNIVKNSFDDFNINS